MTTEGQITSKEPGSPEGVIEKDDYSKVIKACVERKGLA